MVEECNHGEQTQLSIEREVHLKWMREAMLMVRINFQSAA